MQRKMRRRFRQNRTEKLNLVLKIAVVLAMILVLILTMVKIYSVFQNRKHTPGQTVQQTAQPTPAVDSESVEVAAQPTPVMMQREKAVALTFDDGPSRANDGKILNALQKNGAHATFFVLGDRARVDGDILQMYLAAGCEIGSHSWNHPNFSEMKWNKVEKQIDKTDQIVSKLTNGYQISLLRPPYGAVSKKMKKKIDLPMILWSLDTEDWKSRNTKKIVKQVKKEVKDGDIILMHNIYDTTAAAVEQLIPWLQKKGYDVLTVSELMARNNKTIEKGRVYLNGK